MGVTELGDLKLPIPDDVQPSAIADEGGNQYASAWSPISGMQVIRQWHAEPLHRECSSDEEIWVIEGTGLLYVCGEERIISPGDKVIVPKEKDHAIAPLPGTILLTIRHFDTAGRHVAFLKIGQKWVENSPVWHEQKRAAWGLSDEKAS